MKKLFLIGIAFLMFGCGVTSRLERTGGVPAIPPPPAGSAAELTAGTETRTRVWSPSILATQFSGATAEVVDEAVTAANMNGDTSHGASQNALIDYLMATIDADGDGSIADSTLSIAGLTISGAGGLELGVAGTTLGTLKIYSNTPANNFSFDLYGANFTESWGIRVPTAYPGGANYLFNVDADGTGGWTNPATFEPALSAASQAEMEAGTEAALRSMSPLRVAQAIAALAASSSGDVLSVGDCVDGACGDGSSDGGTYIRFYDGDSHYTQLSPGNSIANLTWTFPTAYPGAANALVVSSDAGVLSTLPATTYQPLDAYLTDIADETLAQGDILYFDGTNIANLGPGVNGQFLQTQGAGANPQWGDPAGSGDITAVGDASSGVAFTNGASDGNVANTLYFEGATVNDFEIALAGANAGSDVTVTIPAETGSIVLGPAGFGTDLRLIKTNGTGNLTQVTGISVDASNNITGAASLAASSHIALGADPSDAGSIRLPNAGYIMSEADIAGTDISVIGVTSAEVVAIGASGASGVTITPATTFSGGIANAGTISAGTWQGTAVANAYVADDITLTNITQITSRSIDDISDGTTHQRVAAADVDASGHVNRVYDSDGTGYATITGLSTARAITLVDVAQTLANLGSDQTFTGSLTFGNADTDTLAVQSVLRGANSHAIWIDDDTTVAPTYATTTNSLYTEGPIESGSTIYATSFQVTGSGDSYISLANNAGGRSPGASEYAIWFETDSSDQLKYSVNGSEKAVVNVQDAQTISGAKTLSAALTINRGATGAGQLTIAEDSDDGSNTATITTQAMAASYTLTLPANDGDASQYLQTNGSGTLTWASPTAAAAGSDTQVQFNDGGSALGGDTGFVFNKTTNAMTLGADAQDGSLVLYNELGATDYSTTLVPNASQAADATITFPAATATLSTTAANTYTGNQTAPAFVGNSAANADGEAGYISNAFSWFANSEDMTATAGTNLWTFASGTSATFAFTPAVALNGGATFADSQTLTFDESAADPNDADVRLSATDGVLTITSVNGANNENLTIDTDGTANKVVVGTGTGVTAIDFANIALQAGAKFNSYVAARTATQADNGGGIIQMTTADEVTMWDCTAATIGNFVTLWARDAEKIEVVPASGDQFYLFDGTGIGANDELDMAATAGTKVTLMCTAENEWRVFSETAACADGGAAD